MVFHYVFFYLPLITFLQLSPLFPLALLFFFLHPFFFHSFRNFPSFIFRRISSYLPSLPLTLSMTHDYQITTSLTYTPSPCYPSPSSLSLFPIPPPSLLFLPYLPALQSASSPISPLAFHFCPDAFPTHNSFYTNFIPTQRHLSDLSRYSITVNNEVMGSWAPAGGRSKNKRSHPYSLIKNCFTILRVFCYFFFIGRPFCYVFFIMGGLSRQVRVSLLFFS